MDSLKSYFTKMKLLPGSSNRTWKFHLKGSSRKSAPKVKYGRSKSQNDAAIESSMGITDSIDFDKSATLTPASVMNYRNGDTVRSTPTKPPRKDQIICVEFKKVKGRNLGVLLDKVSNTSVNDSMTDRLSNDMHMLDSMEELSRTGSVIRVIAIGHGSVAEKDGQIKVKDQMIEINGQSVARETIENKFTENANVGSCLNELLQMDYGDVRSRLKLRTANALVHALDNVADSVEISDDDHIIQYVNTAYERLTGYSIDEVLGKDSRELKSERNRPDLQDSINGQLKKGKKWEGTYYTRRKSGDALPQNCCICPVSGSTGKPSHYVSVRSSLHDTSHIYDKLKDSEYFNQIANGGIHAGVARRRESFARIHSMTIEAPITKYMSGRNMKTRQAGGSGPHQTWFNPTSVVINIINTAQENSPLTVVQALDKVVDILRTSELYSPYFAQEIKDDDPMTNDYLGGLVSQDAKRHLITSVSDTYSTKSTSGHSIHHIPHSSALVLPGASQIPRDIQNLLVGEPEWDFNIIELERITHNRPLVYLGLQTMNRFEVCDFLEVPESCLSNWLTMIEANYHSSNTYHNSTHAADVLNCTAYFLQREKIKAIFDPVDEVAALIAAAVHDLDHPGKSNAFLSNSSSDMAVLYNDIAVLESHHVALTYKLTVKEESVNIFKNLDRDTYRVLRQAIIDMVLATEMMKHFEILNKFVNSINKMTQKAEETSSISSAGSPDNASLRSQLSTPENKVLIKRMLIKCADVSNPCRPVDMCIEWAKRIAEEYCLQTDEEKRLGLPVVMPIFDRKTLGLPKSQTSFIDFFINDMFDAWDFFCDIPELLTHLQHNYQFWKSEEENPTIDFGIGGKSHDLSSQVDNNKDIAKSKGDGEVKESEKTIKTNDDADQT